MKQYRETLTRGTTDFPLSVYTTKRESGFENTARLHWHPEIEIVYVYEGEAGVKIGEEQVRLSAGSLCFINSEEMHLIAPNSLPLYYKAIVFSAFLLDFPPEHYLSRTVVAPLLQGHLQFPHRVDLNQSTYASLKPVVEALFDERATKTTLLANLILLLGFFAERGLMVPDRKDIGEKTTEDIKNCLAYMAEHYAEKVTLKDLSRIAHVSPNYFCSFFKRYTGTTPFTHLTYVRIQKAAEMLSGGSDSVETVAAKCGFLNVSFFIKKFKEEKGTTPSQYRRKKQMPVR
ncbi:MAG: helix-turn-helix transcriptional regulator [Clostridia bacterium]|nr:helix-turn-helix transcriptional regulator [Clostridia bacterium]